MWSDRFQKNIWLTHHAKCAMEKRDIPEAVVYDLIETGEIKRKDNLSPVPYEKHCQGGRCRGLLTVESHDIGYKKVSRHR
jgi:hypothetical protein